jgi:hypothetical protein
MSAAAERLSDRIQAWAERLVWRLEAGELPTVFDLDLALAPRDRLEWIEFRQALDAWAAKEADRRTDTPQLRGCSRPTPSEEASP